MPKMEQSDVGDTTGDTNYREDDLKRYLTAPAETPPSQKNKGTHRVPLKIPF